MLDVECSMRGSAESYISKVKAQHRRNPRLVEPKPLEPRLFGIQHFAGRVVYDATDFLGMYEFIYLFIFGITQTKLSSMEAWHSKGIRL